MNEGFILSNKIRKLIFDEFVAGETSIERIIKKNHIIRKVAERVVIDLLDKELLEKKGNKYFLTNDGKKIALNLK